MSKKAMLAERSTTTEAAEETKQRKRSVPTCAELAQLIAEATATNQESIAKIEQAVAGGFNAVNGRLDTLEQRVTKLEGGVSPCETTEPAKPEVGPEPDPVIEEINKNLQISIEADQTPEIEFAKDRIPVTGVHDGLGYGFRYWDYAAKTYRLVSNIFAAKQASNGAYDPVWCWYENGAINHELTPEEILEYCPC